MTFHAPQSSTRIASLLMRRTLFNRATVVAIGAAVTTTVVLAGRGPEIGTAGTEFSEISTSSIALSHLALPEGSPLEQRVSSAVLPATLLTPPSQDAAIASILYNAETEPLQRDIATCFKKMKKSL